MKSAATQFDESTRQEKTTTSTSYTQSFEKGKGTGMKGGGGALPDHGGFILFPSSSSFPCAFVTFVSFDYEAPLLYPRLFICIAYPLRWEMKWNPVRLLPSSFSPFCCLLNTRSLHLYVFAPGWEKGGRERVPNSPWSSADTYRILASSLGRIYACVVRGNWKCWMIFL